MSEITQLLLKQYYELLRTKGYILDLGWSLETVKGALCLALSTGNMFPLEGVESLGMGVIPNKRRLFVSYGSNGELCSEEMPELTIRVIIATLRGLIDYQKYVRDSSLVPSYIQKAYDSGWLLDSLEFEDLCYEATKGLPKPFPRRVVLNRFLPEKLKALKNTLPGLRVKSPEDLEMLLDFIESIEI